MLDVSPIPSSITAHAPGYIDRDNEIIVGLQTEAPLKRAIMPNGGLRMVLSALEAYGHEPEPSIVEAFTKYRKTHNEAVFDAYTADVRRCRSSHVLTGLPDAYGRGRIIGDYRRVALYGVNRLIARKQEEKDGLDGFPATDEIIRDREELAEQIRALKELIKAKRAGKKPPTVEEPRPSNVVNLMDALRRSAKGESGRRAPARSSAKSHSRKRPASRRKVRRAS